MKVIERIWNKIFIDGLSGMALGLFSTLIVGTILVQIAGFIPGGAGQYVLIFGKVASALTGAGIGCGVAYKFKESPLVVLSAASAGMIGAFASKILAGAVYLDGGITLSGPGEPLGAFIAAFVAIMVGHLISGKTKVDILLTPLVSITVGGAVGLCVGPPVSEFMIWLGSIIHAATELQPFLMGIAVSVLMGMILTLPISSAALGVILGLSGLEAGAATVGCCVNMVGFAVISYRENKIGGLLAQGLGTSMLQVPNLVKKPIIWLPVILTSAILGPVSTMGFKMTNDAVGSGMGSAGLVGQFTTYASMTATESPTMVLIKMALIQFILPAVLCLLFSEFMRKKGWIKQGDLKLDL
ncbi:MAG: PTS transporter subunit IIC [Lachnospiraceae bacterium]